MSRSIKVVGIVLGVIVIALVVIPLLIDVNVFRPRIESELSEALGREVKVGNLSLSIFSGSIAAEDLSIADDPAFSKDPFIRAKSLKVGVDVMPLVFSKTLHVTALTVDEPQIAVIRSDAGTWNFSSIGGSKAPKTAQPKGQSSNPNLSVNKLNISNGRLSVVRLNSSVKPHTYDKVNVEVTNFSFASQFPFVLTANLPGGGDIKIDGTAGPINAEDASLTPLNAKLKVNGLDLAASGFAESDSGIAGIMDFDGQLSSDGKLLRSSGTIKADKLKLSPKGAAAGRPVNIKYAIDHDMRRQGGTVRQADVTMGQALAHLSGTYQMRGPATLLNMKLAGDNMPVDDLQAMLPALGVILPPGSSLKGGALSTNLSLTGPTDKLVTSGPIRLSNSKLAGFDLGSKLSAISALSGAQTGSDTSIQNLSTDAQVSPDLIRTDNVNLVIPALGEVTGAGTISPGGALNYKLTAKLTGGVAAGLGQLAGLGGAGGAIPFMLQGTTSHPVFVPDVQGMLSNRLKGGVAPGPNGQSAIDALTGLFGKKKKK